MVPFAGNELPVQYKDGVVQSTVHTRTEGCFSLFDVSHMGQLRWRGKDAVNFIESLVVGDVAGLGSGDACLSLLTNDDGGIIDDTVITNLQEPLGFVNMVVNGATKHGDMAHIDARLEAARARDGVEAEYEYLGDRQLVAVQGPGAARGLAALLDQQGGQTGEEVLKQTPFMRGFEATVAGRSALVTRCGYTGEDGFEVSVAQEDAVHVWQSLMGQEGALGAGLAARDVLRLEAGLCLYGNDIDGTTSPAEANLSWTVAKRRRKDMRFPGADRIVGEIKGKSWARRRVGLLVKGAPARDGAKLFSKEGEEIGVVTSGTFSPHLKKPISMGYVTKGHHKNGTELQVEVRGRMGQATVSKMPFVPSRYYKPE